MGGIRALDVPEINRAFTEMQNAINALQRASASSGTGVTAAQLAQLQASVDALKSQIGGSGGVSAHATTHADGGSDPVSLIQSQTHGSADTDSATTALHHTLGAGANQSAAGNHNHSGVYEPANANIQSHIANTANPHNVTAAQAGAAPASHTHAEADVTNLTTDLAAKEAMANKGAANGYAPLDPSAKVPVSNLPTGLAPGAHATTHQSGGSDPVSGMSGIFDDVVAAAGVTVTIAVGQQMIRSMDAIINGELVINGELRII